MSLTILFIAGNISRLFPARESLVSDISYPFLEFMSETVFEDNMVLWDPMPS
jgi:hypothetical protein